MLDTQLWHPGNRDRKKEGGPCCGGLLNWNFLPLVPETGVEDDRVQLQKSLQEYCETAVLPALAQGNVWLRMVFTASFSLKSVSSLVTVSWR